MRPLNGADSADAWHPRPFRVLVCDRFDPDERRWVTVPAAIGPHDAFSQVRDALPEVSVLRAEEAVPQIIKDATHDFIEKYRDALEDLA